MKEIEINGKKLKLEWDAKAFFRYERAGGTIQDLKDLEDLRGDKSARISTVVIMTWAMLKEDSRAEYPDAESLAPLFIPHFEPKTAEELASVIRDGVKKMEAQKDK